MLNPNANPQEQTNLLRGPNSSDGATTKQDARTHQRQYEHHLTVFGQLLRLLADHVAKVEAGNPAAAARARRGALPSAADCAFIMELASNTDKMGRASEDDV